MLTHATRSNVRIADVCLFRQHTIERSSDHLFCVQMTITSPGVIQPLGDEGSVSKYVLRTTWKNAHGQREGLSFNLSTNTIVDQFKSEGAPARNLTVTFPNDQRPSGLCDFSGTVGDKQMNILISGGVKVNGPIEGGDPYEGKPFSGAGEWGA
jgi:hypothetical protein